MAEFKAKARPPIKIGTSPMPPQAPLEVWSVARVIDTLKKDRSVIVVFENATQKAKYSQLLIQATIESLGPPLTERSTGQNYDTCYWTEVGLGCALYTPDELLKNTPAKTDVVRLAIPSHWK